MAGLGKKKRTKSLSRGKKHQAPAYAPTGMRNRYRFKNFGQQIEDISFERIHTFGSSKAVITGSFLGSISDTESWFGVALGEWRELNCTTAFAHFVSESYGMCGSLAQILYYKSKIVELLVKHLLNDKEALGAAPLSVLTASLVRDLGEEIVPYFKDLFNALMKALGRVQDAPTMEIVLGSVFYFVKTLLPDVSSKTVLECLIQSLAMDKQRPQVQDFIAEFASFVLTRGKEQELPMMVIEGVKDTDLCAAILAGSLNNKKDGLCFERTKIVVELVSLNREEDASSLLAQFIISMVDRSDASQTWTCLAKVISSDIPLNPLLTTISEVCTNKNYNLFASQSTILAALCALPKTVQVQDAIVGLLPKTELNEMLPLRSHLKNIINDVDGVLRLVNSRLELVEPVIGMQVAVKILVDDLFSTNTVEFLSIIHRILIKCPGQSISIFSRLPISKIIELLPMADYNLAFRIISLLSLCHSVESLPWLETSAVMKLEFLGIEEWISLVHVGSRFLIGKVDLTKILLPYIQNIFALEVLVQDPLAIIPIEVLIPVLVSTDHARRLSVLKLLSRHEILCDSELFKLCLVMETVPWTFSCDREKGLHLQAIVNVLKRTKTSQVEGELVVSYLMGVLLVGFQPLRKELWTALSYLVDNVTGPFGRILNSTMTLLLDYEMPLEMEASSKVLSVDEIIRGEFKPISVPKNSPIFNSTSVTPLLQYLAKKPAATNLMRTIFLHSIKSVFYTKTCKSFFSKQMEHSLADVLTSISGLKSAKETPEEDLQVRQILNRFLAFGDGAVQRAALDSTISLRLYEGVGMYEERLRRLLLEDNEMRDELVLLASEQGNLDAVWEKLIQILIPLLYGRMIARKGTVSGRNSMQNRRKLVLNYVATWDSKSIHSFMLFLGQTLEVDGKMEKYIGLLTLLETILAKIGRKLVDISTMDLILNWLENIDNLTRGKEDDDKVKNVKKLVMKRLKDTFAYSSSSLDLSHWSDRVWNLIFGRVNRLEQEYAQEGSALLELLQLWINEPRFHQMILVTGAEVWPRFVALLQLPKAKDSVMATVLDILMSLANMATEGQALNVFKTLVGPLSKALERRINFTTGHSIVLDRSVALLLALSLHLDGDCDDTKRNLISSICQLLGVKGIREDTKARMLDLVVAFNPSSLGVSDQVYPVACQLLSNGLKERASRQALGNLFTSLTTTIPHLKDFAIALNDLHAPSTSRIGEYDYDRQTRGFSNLRVAAPSLSVEAWMPVLHAMLFFCHDENDTAARTLAFTVIEAFVSLTSKNEDPAWPHLVMTVIYPGVKRGLKAVNEGVRVDFCMLLNAMVSTLSLLEPFRTMKPLLADGNDEANFFYNVLHLQQHRRVRALKFLATCNWVEGMSKSSMEDIFIPILKHFVFSDPTSRDPTPPLVVHEATLAMALFISKLGGKSVTSNVLRTVEAIKKGSPCEKAQMKLIAAVFRNLVTGIISNDQGSRLLNGMFGIMMDPGNSTEIKRAPMAVAIAELLPILDNDAVKGYLPKLVTALATMLLHKYEERREEARDILASILQRLSIIEYLPMVLRELTSVLSSGFRPHVLAYTVNVLLERSEKGQNLTSSVVDSCADQLIKIIVMDMFGERAAEKTVKEWTGKIPEVKLSKSGDTLALVIRHVSMDRMMEVLKPLRDACCRSSNSDWCDAACRALEKGLVERKDQNELLVLVYTLLSDAFYSDANAKTLSNMKLHMPRWQLVGARTLLHLLKSFTQSDAQLEQFTVLLLSHVNGSSTALIAASCKCIGHLLRLFVGNLTDTLLEGLLMRLFNLVLTSDASRHADLLGAAFKLLSMIVRDRDDIQLTETQVKALLEYIRSNLESEAGLAYTLLRAIFKRRVILPEVYTLVSTIARTMLRSFHPLVRQQCRAVYLAFLLDYPLGRAKLEEHFAFITANLSYEGDSGRESIALFMASLVERMPIDLVQEMALTWSMALAARLANEKAEACREAVSEAAGKLIARCDERTGDDLAKMLGKWLTNNNPGVVRTAWNFAPILVSSLKISSAPFATVILNAMQHPWSVEMLVTLRAMITHNPTSIVCDLVHDSILLQGCDIEIISKTEIITAYLGKITATLDGVRGHKPMRKRLIDASRFWLKDLQRIKSVPCSESIVKNLLFICQIFSVTPIVGEEVAFNSVTDLLTKVEKIYRQLPTNDTSQYTSSIFKLYAAVLLQSTDPTDEVCRPIMAAVLRCQQSQNDKEALLISQQVLEMLAVKLGDRFTDMRIAVSQGMAAVKRKRVEEEAQLAVIDPKAFSRRRLERSKRSKSTNNRRT